MGTKTISPEIAEALHDGDDGDVEGDWTRLADQHVDSGRWQEHRRLVVGHADGTVWGLDYSVGLTEYQDHTMPWRDATGAPIKLERLYEHTITRIEYRSNPPKVEPPAEEPPVPDGMVRLTLVVTEASTTVDVDAAEYEQAKRDGEVDQMLDVWFSDLDGDNVVIEPNGRSYRPFDEPHGPDGDEDDSADEDDD